MSTTTQAPAGQRHGIKETKEILLALAAAMHSWKEAKEDDGVVSVWEKIGLAPKLANVTWQAVQGAGEVPAEFLDMSSDELDELAVEFIARMGDDVLPDSERARQLIQSAHNILAAILKEVRFHQNIANPPRAVVLPE